MSDLLQVYALCVLALCLKMFAISCYQGFFRLKLKAFTNLEDARFFDRATHAQELPQVVRAAKAWRNDLENIPLFFVLGGLCVALETSLDTTPWLFGIFTVARVVHTVAYLMGWQPWRTLAYGVGVVCLFGMGSVGASVLAKKVNHNPGCLNARVDLAFFASKLAPTGRCVEVQGLRKAW